MTISEKMGALPWLGEIWDRGMLFAAMLVLCINFGIVYLLIWWKWKTIPTFKSLYITFSIGDTVALPLYMAGAVACLEQARVSGFYMQQKYHVLLLALGAGLSVFVVALDVLRYPRSWRRELWLWKLWHTLIFGVVFYWLAASLVAIVTVGGPVWALLCMIFSTLLFSVCLVLDGRLPGAAYLRHKLIARIEICRVR